MPTTRTRLAAAVAVLGLAAICGCSKQLSEKEPVVTVQTAAAWQATIQHVVTAEAILFPLSQSAITPKVSAPVRRFYVNRGSKVHRGQLLAVLENRDLTAAEMESKGNYEQAQAAYQTTTAASLPEEMQKAQLDVASTKEALDAAQKLYDNRQDLFQQGALPRKSLDEAAVALVQARSQYEVAQKRLAGLQAVGHKEALKAASGQLTSAKGKYLGATAQVAYSEIRSPIDGVVTDRPNYPGEMPAPGTPLLTIMDTSQVIARAHIPQEEAAVLERGDPATISSLENGEVAAKVTLVSPALDPNSTTVEVWVQGANPESKLRPGATVNVSIVARTLPNAVVIPVAALLKTPEGEATVMVAGADGRAHQQAVETGIRHQDEVQVTKGLKPGDAVITAGAYGLPDNTKIRAAPATPVNQPSKPSPGKE
jgi:multidrug efflux pump subunit AcrA (membrane-fusion protein)